MTFRYKVKVPDTVIIAYEASRSKKDDIFDCHREALREARGRPSKNQHRLYTYKARIFGALNGVRVRTHTHNIYNGAETAQVFLLHRRCRSSMGHVLYTVRRKTHKIQLELCLYTTIAVRFNVTLFEHTSSERLCDAETKKRRRRYTQKHTRLTL